MIALASMKLSSDEQHYIRVLIADDNDLKF